VWISTSTLRVEKDRGLGIIADRFDERGRRMGRGWRRLTIPGEALLHGMFWREGR